MVAVDVQPPPARAATPSVTAPRRRFSLQPLWAFLPDRAGAFWVLFAMATPKLFGPIFTIGLRRFLGPGASGLFDLAYTPYKFLDNFRNFGTGPALVFEKSVSKAAANTAWTLNMLFAVAVTGVAQLLAHPVALCYGHPEIEGVFRVLSIAYVFASMSSVHSFLLMRDLDFRARSIPALGQVIAAGDLAVLFAVWGFGVGSLARRGLLPDSVPADEQPVIHWKRRQPVSGRWAPPVQVSGRLSPRCGGRAPI